jgi:hypothetical protein
VKVFGLFCGVAALLPRSAATSRQTAARGNHADELVANRASMSELAICPQLTISAFIDAYPAFVMAANYAECLDLEPTIDIRYHFKMEAPGATIL